MGFLVENMFVKWIIKLEHSEISTKRQILTESVKKAMDQTLMMMLKVTMASGNIQPKRSLFWWLKKLNMQINWKERCLLVKLRANITQMHLKCQQQVDKISHQEKILLWEAQKISSSNRDDLALTANQLPIKNNHKQSKTIKSWRVLSDLKLIHCQDRMKLYSECLVAKGIHP